MSNGTPLPYSFAGPKLSAIPKYFVHPKEHVQQEQLEEGSWLIAVVLEIESRRVFVATKAFFFGWVFFRRWN